ncbi:MAG: RNA polymerase sigma factor [Gemmatimonadota bacterium]
MAEDGRHALIPMADAARTVEAVARTEYGRLLAYLSSEYGDVHDAEDALGQALLAALTSWPDDGVPKKPAAWLRTVARHRLLDRARRRGVRDEHAHTLRVLAAEPESSASVGEMFPDRRVELLFVCAHPALDPALHAPLMLQTVLGLTAARIAQAFLVAPATMGQRLVRAKRKIRDAGIPFQLPAQHELPARLDAVLEAIYGAYGLGRDEAAGADTGGRDLMDEAIWLARVIRERMPEQPEVRGLLALMLFCHSRREARSSSDGRYVPLSDQDPATWSSSMIQEAEAELAEAARSGRIGRFQLEAAIQSVHADRARSGRTDWAAIAVFYSRLVRLAPTLGARVAQAAAVAEASGPAAGLALLDALDALDETAVATYQPYWAVRGHLLRLLDRGPEATAAYDRAIGLTEDPAVRRFLLDRRG